MPNIQIPQIFTLLTADGGVTGLLTIADTTKIYPGAIIYLNATGLPALELQVLKVPNSTTLQVRLNRNETNPGKIYDAGVDLSSYTMLLNASISQDAQLCPVESNMSKMKFIP